MSERFGKCNFCAGTGQRMVPIPGSDPVMVPTELTEEETAALKALNTGCEAAPAFQVTTRYIKRVCYMCDGTPGFSGDAMEGYTP